MIARALIGVGEVVFIGSIAAQLVALGCEVELVCIKL